MTDSIYASKAQVGAQYITKGGWPITVLEVGSRIRVREQLTGDESRLYPDMLLWPYSKERITKEAITMASIAKAGTKKAAGKVSRGGERGARKEGTGIILFRKMGTVLHEVLCHEGVLTYRSKDYMNLREVAQAIRGKAVSGSGRSFFGLRSEPNIGLGKQVLKELADAEAAKRKAEADAAKAAKVKKTAKKKEQDEEEDDEKPTAKAASTVGQVVAKVFGKRR